MYFHPRVRHRIFKKIWTYQGVSFEEFAPDTCIQMVEVKRDDPAYKNKMSIKQCCGCTSFVGRIHKEQMVSLVKGNDDSEKVLTNWMRLKVESHEMCEDWEAYWWLTKSRTPPPIPPA